MRRTNQSILLLLFLFLCVGLNAQRSLRKANKQYDLHAYNLAIDSYLKTLEKNPDSPEALWKLANSYRMKNQMDQAATYFARAAAQNRVDPLAYLYYGHTLKALQRYDDAAIQYRRYAEFDPIVGAHYAQTCEFAKTKSKELSAYDVKSEYVNTTASDFAATPYGIKTVFASSRTDIRPRGEQRQNEDLNNRLFLTDSDKNGYLKPPALLREGLQDRGNEGPVAYSPDGRWVAITKNNFVDGTRQIPDAGLELSLYIAEVTQNGNWSSTSAFPFNGTGFSTGYGSFSPDGRALYFASDRPDGFGGFDLYVSYRVGTSWSTPENLGAVVNSQGNELAPHFDGTSLYFSSDWHPGLGAFDIFRAERANERWTNIYSLGSGINSSRDDLYYSFDNINNKGHLTSNRTGRGQEDIYHVTKTSDNIVIQVKDAVSRIPIGEARIDFSSCGDRVYTTDRNGMYSFQVRSAVQCTPIVRKEGYASTSLSINTRTAPKNQTVEVLLKKTGDQYVGRVTDQSNGLRIGDVLVRVTDPRTGQTRDFYTNSAGEYRLELAPNTSYTVRYSRANYVDTNRSIRTGANYDPNLLTTVSLSRAGTAGTYTGPTTNTGTTTTTPTRPSGGQVTGGTTTYPSTTRPSTSGGSVTYPGNSPSVVYPGSTTTTTTTRPPTSGGSVTYPSTTTGTTTYPSTSGSYPEERPTISITSGFSVQLLATGKDPDMNKFQREVGSLGDVYYRTANGINKVRVGVYTTRADAERIKANVRRMGYSQAFVVDESQSNGAAYTGGGFGGSSSGSTTISTGSVTYPNSTYTGGTTTTTTTSGGNYHIKLGVYSKPQFFPRDKAVQLGVLTERMQNGMTVFLLSNYYSADEARQALSSVRSRGFADAYVVQDVGGTLQRVR